MVAMVQMSQLILVEELAHVAHRKKQIFRVFWER